MSTAASYIVYTDGSDYYAYDVATASVTYSGSAASSAFSTAIAGLASGGEIHVRPGTYLLTADIALTSVQHICVIGEPGTILDGSGGATRTFIGQDSSDITLAGLEIQNSNNKAIILQRCERVLMRDLRILESNNVAIELEQCTDVRIERCTIDGAQWAGITNVNQETRRLWITQCHVRDVGRSIVDVEQLDPDDEDYADQLRTLRVAARAVPLNRVVDCFVDRNVIEENHSSGITITTESRRVHVTNNVCHDNGQYVIDDEGHGIYIGNVTDQVEVRGNVVTSNSGHGIEANASQSVRTLVAGNSVKENGRHQERAGIYVVFSDVTVQGNQITDNEYAGIMIGVGATTTQGRQVIVQGNVVARCGSAADTDPENNAGIWIGDASANSLHAVQVQNNLIWSGDDPNQTPLTSDMGYGIYSEATEESVVIEHNRIYGFGTAAIGADTFDNHRIRRNVGFVTENSGVADISLLVAFPFGGAAPTFVDVAHGLDVEPDAQKLQVTPLSNLFPRSFWISDVGPTTFRINTSRPSWWSSFVSWARSRFGGSWSISPVALEFAWSYVE